MDSASTSGECSYGRLPPIKCSICGTIFSNKKYLNRHMNKIHNSDTNVSFSGSEQEREVETCSKCRKVFSNLKNLKAHLKRFHRENSENIRRNCHMFCPLCEEKNQLKNHEDLIKHLKIIHHINVDYFTYVFSCRQEYDNWKNEEKVETSFAVHRTLRYQDHTEVHFACNRSDIKGYQTNYKKITEKAGGSIKIHGICPAKIICKEYSDGQISIMFWKTHAGHKDDDHRSKHLSTLEKKTIVEKLKAGIPSERILEDARKLKTPKLERINLLSRDDIKYLSKKHNVDNKRDKNEMVAVALKVKEWTENGKNFAFLFKQEGETHEILKKEDFAVGFMNSMMEDKLRKFSKIICIDGTHGTNKRGMDLTVMLIKDDRNAGFPVAFFLSNRLDQEAQEVFLKALKERVQEIKPEYIMTDDDPKYYNAWVKIMGNQPRRLLCTWHVVKNWNIQGKKKLKDAYMKKQMKSEMKRIINETNEQEFLKLVSTYLLKLETAEETDFINYLKRYYFQDNERMQMWAHCYRKNSGINTNMAIESLNNLLKTNQLKRNARVTIEKLLDKIEELVDIKMWKRILEIERPTSNTYQDRIIIKAHKLAEMVKDNTIIIENEEEYGQFRVKSSTNSTFYNVNIKQVCENECRTLYCRVCKICIHRYQCNCPEYVVKNTLCKHVHLVRMFEERKGTNYVLDEIATCLGERSAILKENNEEINKFIQEKHITDTNQEVEMDNQSKRNIKWTHFKNWAEDLDDETFELFMNEIQGVMKKVDHRRNEVLKKRKMEKQEYFPTKKHARV